MDNVAIIFLNKTHGLLYKMSFFKITKLLLLLLVAVVFIVLGNVQSPFMMARSCVVSVSLSWFPSIAIVSFMVMHNPVLLITLYTHFQTGISTES